MAFNLLVPQEIVNNPLILKHKEFKAILIKVKL